MILDNAFDPRNYVGFIEEMESPFPRELTTDEMRKVARSVELFVSAILAKYYDHGDQGRFDVLIAENHFEFYLMCDQKADSGVFFRAKTDERKPSVGYAINTIIGPKWIRTGMRFFLGPIPPLPPLPERGIPLLFPSIFAVQPRHG